MAKAYGFKVWTKEDDEFLKNNYTKYSRKELGELLGRTVSSIQNRANRLGLKQDDKYTYNKDFFEVIDTEEKAYWLGFIFADGYVNQSKNKTGSNSNNELGIELSVKDINHLKKFNKSLNGNVQVNTRERICFDGVKCTMCNIRLYSKKIVDDLSQYHIVNDKTHKKEFPIIEDTELFRHFMRGYFDGDGCVVDDKVRKVPRCDYCSINIDALNYFREKLYKNYNICSYIMEDGKKLGTDNRGVKSQCQCYRLMIRGMQNTLDFYHFLYDNATIWMERKRNVFEKCHSKYNIEQRIEKT